MKRNIILTLAVTTLCFTACSIEQEPNAPQPGVTLLAGITTNIGASTRNNGKTIITNFVNYDKIALTYYLGSIPHIGGYAVFDAQKSTWLLPPKAIYLDLHGYKILDAEFIPNPNDELVDVNAGSSIYYDRLKAEAKDDDGDITFDTQGAVVTLTFKHARALITLGNIKDSDDTNISPANVKVQAFITDPEGTPRKLDFISMNPHNPTDRMAIAPEGSILRELRVTYNGQTHTTTATPIKLEAGKSYPVNITLKKNTAISRVSHTRVWNVSDFALSYHPTEQ